MFIANQTDNPVKNTTFKVVLPFYVYAALAFLLATIFLFFSTSAFTQHYFHPKILAITHIMALGWSTMIILGASHQLVPVLIEGKLFSTRLAYVSFVLAAAGIPLLVYGFYQFNMGWPAKWGAILINVAILAYLINLAISMVKSQKENVHALFVFTAALWLLLTTFVGLLLVFNFSDVILAKDSLHYLPLHAHIGFIGWFLLLVTGVGSRLIPMFLISKYANTKLLWAIYFLINFGLLSFILFFLFFHETAFYYLPVTAIVVAILFFGFYCFSSYQQRIRKQVDEQMKISIFSLITMLLPFLLLITILGWLPAGTLNAKWVMLYGFLFFFGWITTIIFGMTFKTLPFIVWNKVYHLKAGFGKTPNPKDLFSNKIFKVMVLVYQAGCIFFIIGVYQSNIPVLQLAGVLLVLAALLYNWNVFKVLLHKPVQL